MEVRGKRISRLHLGTTAGQESAGAGLNKSASGMTAPSRPLCMPARYLMDGNRTKRVWMLYDDVQHCEFDAALRFDQAATKVTDLSGDGHHPGHCGLFAHLQLADVSPNEFKLIMHVGKSQEIQFARCRPLRRAAWWDERPGRCAGCRCPRIAAPLGNRGRSSASTRSRAPNCRYPAAMAMRGISPMRPRRIFTSCVSIRSH